ncbi:hypothetical protein ACFWJW_13405 [Streptomyces sp. NPDC127097]|uniref:hypothetical protein n=1 Tax=Streptomyces sp. NPDC127097 TaxID=3347136 RepID=UPI0036639636
MAVPCQWLSSVAWDALIGLFGGEALAQLLGWPFWLGALVILLRQGVVGVFGYEALHQLQTVMTFVLGAAFVVLSGQLLSGVPLPVSGSAHGADRFGAFVLTSTVASPRPCPSWTPPCSSARSRPHCMAPISRTTSRSWSSWRSMHLWRLLVRSGRDEAAEPVAAATGAVGEPGSS